MCHGSALYSVCAAAGCVQEIVALASTPDPLLQMNTLGLLVGLSYSPQGMEYFFSNGVATWLLELAGMSVSVGSGGEGQRQEQGEPDAYLGPVSLEVLATIFTNAAATGSIGAATTNAQYSDTILAFTKAMLSAVASSPESSTCAHQAANMQFAALHSLAIFTASSKVALTLVLQNNELVSMWCELLNSTKAELVGATLMSIAHVLAAEVDVDAGVDATVFQEATAAVTSATSTNNTDTNSRRTQPVEDSEEVKVLKTKLVRAIGTAKNKNPVTYLLVCAHQPLAEVKQGASRVLVALARNVWGLNLLFSGDNATEGSPLWKFLHDYHHVDGKAQKEWKYEVICAIASSRGFSHLRADLQGFVSKRVQQGAYFVPADMEEPMVM